MIAHEYTYHKNKDIECAAKAVGEFGFVAIGRCGGGWDLPNSEWLRMIVINND